MKKRFRAKKTMNRTSSGRFDSGAAARIAGLSCPGSDRGANGSASAPRLPAERGLDLLERVDVLLERAHVVRHVHDRRPELTDGPERARLARLLQHVADLGPGVPLA